jgi:hypothetical protein
MSEPNPFEVLRLDPTATDEEVVRQAGRLRQRSADEAALAAVRQAVQALTGPPEERLLLAVLTHPRPAHGAPVLERLAAAYRRAPTSAGGAAAPFEAAEFLALLLNQAAAGPAPPPAPLEDVGGDEDAAEVRRQAAEALWLSLLYDARA